MLLPIEPSRQPRSQLALTRLHKAQAKSVFSTSVTLVADRSRIDAQPMFTGWVNGLFLRLVEFWAWEFWLRAIAHLLTSKMNSVHSHKSSPAKRSPGGWLAAVQPGSRFAIPRIPLHICSPHSHGELLSLPCPSSHSSLNRFGLKGMRAWQGGFIQDPRSRRSLEFRRGWEMSNPEVRLELRMVVAEGKWNSRLAMIDRGPRCTLGI